MVPHYGTSVFSLLDSTPRLYVCVFFLFCRAQLTRSVPSSSGSGASDDSHDLSAFFSVRSGSPAGTRPPSPHVRGSRRATSRRFSGASCGSGGSGSGGSGSGGSGGGGSGGGGKAGGDREAAGFVAGSPGRSPGRPSGAKQAVILTLSVEASEALRACQADGAWAPETASQGGGSDSQRASAPTPPLHEVDWALHLAQHGTPKPKAHRGSDHGKVAFVATSPDS